MNLGFREKDITLSEGELRVFRLNVNDDYVIVSACNCMFLQLPRDKAQELAAALLLIASDDPIQSSAS